MRKCVLGAFVLVAGLTLGGQAVLGLTGGTYTLPWSFFDYWGRVADRVADCGGVYLGDDGHIHVYLLDPDPARRTTVAQALIAVFGEEVFTGTTGMISLHQGSYTVGGLLDMKDTIVHLIDSPGVLYIDLDESQNLLRVLVSNHETAELIPLHLRAQGIPDEAVAVEVHARTVAREPVSEEELLDELVESWHQRIRAARVHDLPGVGSVAYIWHDLVVPFRIELTSSGSILLLARELRALDIPLSAVFLYERE